MSFKKCALKSGITSEDMAEIRRHVRLAENDAQGVQDYLDGIEADLNDLRKQTGTELVTEQVETAGEAITGSVVDLIRGMEPNTLNQAQSPSVSQDNRSASELQRDLFKMKGVSNFALSTNINGIVSLDAIQIRKEERAAGLGTEVMNELLTWADVNNSTVALTPSNSLGGSVKRLKSFYKNLGFVENKGKNKDFEISESMYREPQKVFKQEGKKDPRGQIQILPDSALIKLFEAANRSTFLHEAGHLFLDMTGKLYNHEKATPEIKEDGDAILKFLGVDSFDNVTTEQHEKWARAQEKYFGEGKAPSLELQGAFRRFAQWLKHIYLSLNNLNVELTDDIRQVMDRMLATDDQIDRVKGSFKPLFSNAEDAGMTKAEFKAYDGNASPEAAKEELLKKLVKELRRKETKFWKDEKAIIQKKVVDELEKMPVYSAEKFLRGEEAENKILKSEVKALFPGKIPRRLAGMVSDTGASAESLAPMFGFASGEEMINNISNSKTINQQASEAADIQMMNKHGDILNDGRIEEEAELALRNESRAKKLLAELRSLGRKTNKPAIDRASLREYAKAKIATMKIRRIYPAQFRAAEIRSARAAAIAKSKGDIDGAQEAKTQEIINFYLGKEAAFAKDKAEKQRSYLRAVESKKYDAKKYNNDPYVNNAKILAAVFDFRKSSRDSAEKNRQKLDNVRLWIESQLANDPEKTPEQVSPYLAQAEILNRLIPYAEMTVDDLSGLNDTVVSLMKAARETSEQSNKIFKDKMNVVGDSIVKFRIKEYRTEIDNDTPYIKARELFNGATSMLRKMDSLARQADGFVEQGPVWKGSVKPILDAATNKLVMNAKAGEDMKDVFRGYDDAFGSSIFEDTSKALLRKGGFETNENKKTFTFESGQVHRLSYGARVMMVVNMGNIGNHHALTNMKKFPVTENDLNRVMESLTDKDIDLVEGIWAYVDTFWAESSAIEKARSGAAPTKIAPRSFATPSGRIVKGGYFPLVKDPAEDTRKGDIDTRAMAIGSSLSKATQSGSMIERTNFGGAKIDFSINAVFNHVEEIIHDITHYQAVADSSKFLASQRVREELTISLGKDGYDAMVRRLKETAAGPEHIEGLGKVERLFRHARLATIYNSLGGNAATGLKNLAGFTAAVPEVGATNLALATADYIANKEELTKFILSKDPYMKERGEVVSYAVAQAKSSIKSSRKMDKVRDYSFVFIIEADKLVTRPIWLAQYRKGLTMFDTEEGAIDYAKQTVQRTQGAGDVMNLSSIETRNEFVKILTVMYSPMNAMYNIAVEQALRYQARNIEGAGSISASRMAGNLMWLTVGNALVMTLIAQVWNEDDEDEKAKSFALELAKETGNQVFGMVPMAREAYSLARYSMSFPSPAVDLIGTPYYFLKDVSEGKLDKGLVRSATSLAAAVAHVPFGVQITKTSGYIFDMLDNEIDTFSPYELIVTGKE